jgi:carboxymethylenebutenolidase
MTQTHTEDYERADGRALRMTFAEPDGPARGGLVVLYAAPGNGEGSGDGDGPRKLLTGLAAEGWLAVAPHLDGIAHAEDLTGEQILAANDIALAWLVDRGVRADLLGVVGFDLGGTAALVVAAGRKLGAAVSVGGVGITEPASAGLPALVDIAGSLTSPWLGLYGDAGDEASEADIERLSEAAAGASVAANVVRYPGADHRFDADPDAAAEAWQRTLDWFDAHLR